MNDLTIILITALVCALIALVGQIDEHRATRRALVAARDEIARCNEFITFAVDNDAKIHAMLRDAWAECDAAREALREATR